MSVLPNTRIEKDDAELKRSEAEYFKKKYLELESRFKNYPTLGSLVKKITCGPFGSNLLDTLYTDKGVLVVRPFNLKNAKIEADNLVFISEEDAIANSLKLFSENTLLFSRVGDIKIGVQSVPKATISPNIIAAEFENEKYAHFLVFFFQTRFGFDQIERELKIAAQPTISTSIISNLKIPVISDKLLDAISEIYYATIEKENQFKSLYTAAENLLLEELGLLHWQPTRQSHSTKTFAQSYQNRGRLDAEYYQPKYDEIIALLADDNLKPLGNIVSIQKSIEPGSDAYQAEGIPFIRVADLSKNGLSEPNIFLSAADFGEFPVMPKKDTILLSKDGSVGIAYKVEEDLKAITSGAILHLAVTDKNVLPDYLTLVLNSIVVKLQAERDAGGSIIQHWKPDEIKKVLIPVIDMNLQSQITTKIQQSFALQQQSKQLLEAAKTAVEIAIEQDEAAALKYLNTLEKK